MELNNGQGKHSFHFIFRLTFSKSVVALALTINLQTSFSKYSEINSIKINILAHDFKRYLNSYYIKFAFNTVNYIAN